MVELQKKTANHHKTTKSLTPQEQFDQVGAFGRQVERVSGIMKYDETLLRHVKQLRCMCLCACVASQDHSYLSPETESSMIC